MTLNNNLLENIMVHETPMPSGARGSGAGALHPRWMTDISAQISRLKLHQLAWPSAHNAGVDMAGTSGLEELYWACQTKSFRQQLDWGARVLDLRLYDDGYPSPELMYFRHVGGASRIHAGRNLRHCIEAVDQFTSQNPGEIVILNFHEYNARPSLSISLKDRVLPLLRRLRSKLIPNAALNLSIGELRASHPGKCIIVFGLSTKFLGPDNPEIPYTPGQPYEPGEPELLMYSRIPTQWTNESQSDEDKLVAFAQEKTNSPPALDFWTLSAAHYGTLGPDRLGVDHELWGTIFREGFNNASIVNVDFIEDTPVVDYCIELNVKRGNDTQSPSAFSITKATQLHQTNSVMVSWDQSQHHLGVAYYELYVDGVHSKSSSHFDFVEVNASAGKHKLEMKAVTRSGYSAPASAPFEFWMNDSVDPIAPPNVRLSYAAPYTATLEWDASEDEFGIDGYVIYNGKDQELAFTRSLSYNFSNLDPKKRYQFLVRAKDNSGRFSSGTHHYMTLFRRKTTAPEQVLMKVTDVDAANVLIELTWERFDGEYPHYGVTSGNSPEEVVPLNQYQTIIPKGAERIFKIRTIHGYDTTLPPHYSEPTELRYAPNTPVPGAVQYFQQQSVSRDAVILAWNKPDVGDIKQYAVQVNLRDVVYTSEPSIRISDLGKLVPHIASVWSIDRNGVSSGYRTHKFFVDAIPPAPPGDPVVSNIVGTTATVTWDRPAGNSDLKDYVIKLNTDHFVTVEKTRNSFTLSGLHIGENVVGILARDIADNVSVPVYATFMLDSTAPTRPGTPVINDLTGNSAMITWSASSDENSVVGYEVVLNDGQPVFVTDTAHRFEGLQESTTYTVQVRARDASNNLSPPSTLTFSTLETVKPSPPEGLVADKLEATWVRIVWLASTDNVGVVGYEVRLNGGSPVIVPTLYHALQGLEEATDYVVEVRAVDAANNFSDPSATTFRTLANKPTAPTGLEQTGLTYATVQLTWKPASDNILIVGYQVSRDGVVLRRVIQTQYNGDWLSHGTRYLYEVRSVDTEGNLSDPASIEITTLDAPTRPGPPTDLILGEDLFVYLQWTKPTVGDVLAYLISRNDKQWAMSLIDRCIIVKPPEGESWLYEVRATDKAGQYSEPVSIRLGTAPPTNKEYTRAFALSVVRDAGAGVELANYQVQINDAPAISVSCADFKLWSLALDVEYRITVRKADRMKPQPIDETLASLLPARTLTHEKHKS